MAMVPCSRCGKLNRAGAKFCSGCGQTIAAQPPLPAFSPQQNAPPPRPTGGMTRVMRPTSYILIGLGIIAGFCIVVAMLFALLVQSGALGNIALGQTTTPTLPGSAPATPATLGLPTATLASAATAPPGATSVRTATNPPAPFSASPTGNVVGTAIPTAVPPASGKALGDPWETEGAQLNLINLDVRAGNSGSYPAVAANFAFVNKTGQRILVEVDYSKLYVEDSQGARYVDYEGAKTDSVWVDAGKRWDFTRNYSRVPQQLSRVPANAKYVAVVVEKFSRLANVRWRYDINPLLSQVPAPPSANVKPIGQAWEQNGIQVTVSSVDVQAGQGGSYPAFAVDYKAVNRTNQRVLLEIDWSDLYVTDSFGVRFNDYNGGGYDTVWVDAGKDFQFERAYSTQANSHSRISPGAEYALVNVRKFSRLQNALWQYNIVR